MNRSWLVFAILITLARGQFRPRPRIIDGLFPNKLDLPTIIPPIRFPSLISSSPSSLQPEVPKELPTTVKPEVANQTLTINPEIIKEESPLNNLTSEVDVSNGTRLFPLAENVSNVDSEDLPFALKTTDGESSGKPFFDDRLRTSQVFVVRGEDGLVKGHKLVEIITAPNLVEIGPPRVIDCKIYGDHREVRRKLNSDLLKAMPAKHVTENVMKSLVNKCQEHMVKGISDRSKQSNQTEGVKEVTETDDANWLKGLAIYPGTKWCGAGNIADNIDDLGLDKKADACCREHDQCDDSIEGGETKYNLTNPDGITRSHCDCDSKFSECLKEANTQIGHQIGRSFFNIIQIKCFKEDHPQKGCREGKGFLFNTIRNACQEYELDTSQPKSLQFFDPPFYDGESGPLLYIPIVSDVVSKPFLEVKDKLYNGGILGSVIG